MSLSSIQIANFVLIYKILISKTYKCQRSCADPECFFRGGPFFFSYSQSVDPNTTKIGPSSALQRNAI